MERFYKQDTTEEKRGGPAMFNTTALLGTMNQGSAPPQAMRGRGVPMGRGVMLPRGPGGPMMG
eukprot:3430672-Rhodomonas_salina.1